jgi:hypothetical protein
MFLEILLTVVAVAIILGICAVVKFLCKKYINLIDKKQH